MANEENDLIEPELDATEDSELRGCVDTSFVDANGSFRPVLIDYGSEDGDILAMTLDDAERLGKFLEAAIKHIKEFNKSKYFPN